MALLTRHQSQITGTQVTYVPAGAGGDTFAPDDHTALHVVNDDVAPITATVVVPGTKYGQALPDVPVVVPAGGHAFIGPYPRDLAVNGVVTVNYSAVANVTVGLLRV